MPNGIPRVPEPREWVLSKTCTRCAASKAWAHFAPRGYWPDGSVRVVASRCHTCDGELAAVRAKKYRERHYREHRDYQNEWQRRKRAAIRADRAGTGAMLPVDPLQVLLAGLMTDGTFTDYATLAEASGVSDRTIRRIFSEQRHTSLHIADTICTRLGVPLSDLYPEEVAA